MAQKKKAWSYVAGRKGVNRVRAYEDGPGGPLLLEWQERVFDNQGIAVTDPRTGKQATRRARLSLTAEGITSRSEAIMKAEQTAESFAKLDGEPVEAERPSSEGPLTLKRLLDLYLEEVSPTLRQETQRQHRGHARIFLAYFGPNAIVERIGRDGRPVTQLGRVAYNEFLRDRSAGAVPGYPARVRGQTLLNDVRFMRAVFNWAQLEREDGSVLMLRNPWKGFPSPREDTPMRVEMTPELHEQLVAGAANWRMAEVLELCRATRRRMNSVRQIALKDLDLDAGTCRWVGEYDKARKTRVTPLSKAALAAIRRILAHRKLEGVHESPWLFPGRRNPAEPVAKSTLGTWMVETKKRLGIKIAWLGYHGEKRAGIRCRTFRKLPVEVREELAGTTWATMRRVYDYVDLPTLHDAVATLDRDASARRGRRKAA